MTNSLSRNLPGRWAKLAVWAIAPTLFLLAACATTPVGVVRVDPRDVHRELTRDVLSSEEPSTATQNTLQEQNLADLYDEQPEAALAKFHAHVAAGSMRGSELFALAELSFLHAERSRKPSYHLAAAIYAYAFIFPDEPVSPPDPLDARLRAAADLYNRGITAAFKAADGFHLELRSGTYALPFGEIAIVFDETGLNWAGRRLVNLAPVAELKVRGLKARYRQPGIGAPLAATPVTVPGDAFADDFLSSDTKVPVTAFLRLERPRSQLTGSRLEGALEAHIPRTSSSSPENTVIVGNRRVPLEVESTAALAYALAESPIWEQEISHFFDNLGVAGTQRATLTLGAPYRPGRIPVVLVHGTASSAGRWAALVNRLTNDPRIGQRYQFWFFTYETGNPIGYSAMLLRDALRNAIARLDPDGQDPELQHMIVIGHSQGGLLTKLLAIDSGSRLYDASFKRPLEELDVSEATRELFRRTRFVEPLPFVQRVIFLATPHRGSYLTLTRFSEWIARLIKLPFSVVGATADVFLRNRDAMVNPSVRPVTSLDQMNPRSSFIQALASIPIAPGVRAHSIIAVKGDGPIAEGDDGVVKYTSAHIDGVESELVVRSDHSVQWAPEAIEEVRRILLMHAKVN
jgi:pimeloyl-ACP methyl ester carboxylesterase